MKLSDVFPSNYLTASNLNGQSVVVRMSAIEAVEMGKGHEKKTKLLISFLGKKKQFVCNKTNANTISKLYGDDTDGWINQPITIRPMEVEFGGEMVLSIRVSLQKPVTAQPAPTHGVLGKPAVRPAPVVEPDPDPDPDPEPAPFEADPNGPDDPRF